MTPMPGKILCIQPLPGIGDLIWYLPHLRAIADSVPGKKITLLTKRSSMANQLLSHESWCEDIIWLEKDRRPGASSKQRHDGFWGLWHLIQDLKAHHFESAWILHGSTTYALACTLAGIPRVHAYTFRRFNPFISCPTRLNETVKRDHPRARMSQFLESNNLSPEDYCYPLIPAPEALVLIEAFLKPIAPQTPIIFGIGASGPEKCWPLEKFMDLAKILIEKGYPIVLSGGPAERPAAQLILKKLGHPQRILDGTNFNFQETIALFANARLYIGNDTSLMNLAVNQQKRAITFFGPTYTVYSELVIPVCSPTCHIQEISIEQVVKSVFDYEAIC